MGGARKIVWVGGACKLKGKSREGFRKEWSVVDNAAATESQLSENQDVSIRFGNMKGTSDLDKKSAGEWWGLTGRG